MTFEEHVLLKTFLAATGELDYCPEDGQTPEDLEESFQEWCRVRGESVPGERLYKTLLAVAKRWARDRWYEMPESRDGMNGEAVYRAVRRDRLTAWERDMLEEATAADRNAISDSRD